MFYCWTESPAVLWCFVSSIPTRPLLGILRLRVCFALREALSPLRMTKVKNDKLQKLAGKLGDRRNLPSN